MAGIVLGSKEANQGCPRDYTDMCRLPLPWEQCTLELGGHNVQSSFVALKVENKMGKAYTLMKETILIIMTSCFINTLLLNIRKTN